MAQQPSTRKESASKKQLHFKKCETDIKERIDESSSDESFDELEVVKDLPQTNQKPTSMRRRSMRPRRRSSKRVVSLDNDPTF